MNNCLDCEYFGPCEGRHGCANKPWDTPTQEYNRHWFDIVRDFFAALGMIASATVVGLYFSGLFHWLAKKMPDSTVLQYFFGAAS